MNSTATTPSATIVIPTHDRRELLRDAVESSLNQSWENCEVIIVDDGSTDGTGDLVAELINSTWPKDRVSYIKQQNRGASSARNHGLRLARGRYVQFLDSDDRLNRTKIAKQIAILEVPENGNAVCCHCYGAMGSLEEEPASTQAARIGFAAVNPRDLVRELCTRRVHGMQTSAPLWRRDFLMQHAGWREDISLGDDLEYHVRLLVSAEKICFVDEELFFVREHAASRLSTGQMSAASIASLIRTRETILSSLQKADLWDTQTQRAFLGAMRTIYANALQLGNHETIRDLEEWLWALADGPERNREFHALILLRRMFGRRFLLGAHKLTNALRPS